MGDFNINVDVSCSSLPLSRQLTAISDLLSLKQVVSSPTHTSHTGSTYHRPCLCSIPCPCFDLVLPPVSSSDHNSTLTEISLPSPHLSRKFTKHHIWLESSYKSCKAVHLLSSIQWDLLSSDLDFSLKVFKGRFSAVINLCSLQIYLILYLPTLD